MKTYLVDSREEIYSLDITEDNYNIRLNVDLWQDSLVIHEQRGKYWRKSRYDDKGYIRRKWSNGYFGTGIRYFVCYWYDGKLIYRRDEQKTIFRWNCDTIYYKDKWPDIGWTDLQKHLRKILPKLKKNFKSEYKFWKDINWSHYRNNKIDYQATRLPNGGINYIPNNLYKFDDEQEEIEEENEPQLSLF